METSVWVFSGDEAHQPEKFLSWGYRGNLPRKETLKPEMRELHGKQITSIFAGKNHMAAVSGAWKLYMWGENSTGQLGLDSEYIETHYVPTPTLVSNDMLDLHPIKMVALGKYHSVCITDDGVVAWGKTELLGQPLTKPTKQTSSTLFLESTTVSIPQVIPMSEPVTHVSCGAGHTTLTTESGDLYTFGTGSMGQLGHGDTSDRSQPTLVEALKKGNRFIVSAACGGFHTIAVTRDGKVYAFGLASYGQTGQGPGTESVINTPRVVSLPQGVQISAAACGESHSLLLSTQGHVYAFGYNIYGQCGQGNRRDQHSPMAVKFEAGASENPPKIDTIACGNNHNAAVTSDGKLYMWGNGGKHQITKATKDRLAPELVPISEVTSVENALVSSVALGETFTMVLLGGPTKTPTTTINTDLSTLLLVHDFSDIKFTVRDDLRFHAHKVIVFNRCPALREEFGEGTSEIKLPDIGKEAIYKILEYLYTDYTYVEEESATAKEVLEFSGKYGLTKLANMCGVLSEGSPSTFIKDLTTALQNAPKFHDISFSVGETQIHANKAILAARCKFFRAMFTSGYQESVQETIEITDCREQTFATFLEWCYTDRINLNLPQTNNTNNSTNNTENSSENNENSNENGREEGEEGSSLLPEMLVLADKYGAFGLFRQVEARMLEGVDPSNILALLQFAETYNANFLGEFCLNFIAREYDTLATRIESEASEDVLRRVREKRAAMLVGSREERLRREMAERMRAYEIERNESVTNPEISMGLIADIMKARKEKGEEERKVKGPSTQPNCRTS